CVRLDASDLHLSTGLPPYFRVHGLLTPHAEHGAMSAEHVEAVVTGLTHGRSRGDLDATGSLDGAVTAADGTRFRFNVFRRQSELAVAIRRLEARFRPLSELGLPDSLYGLCELPDGLVLVCGPTGAGKSTTLATLLDRVNQTRPCHVVTIEDPI